MHTRWFMVAVGFALGAATCGGDDTQHVSTAAGTTSSGTGGTGGAASTATATGGGSTATTGPGSGGMGGSGGTGQGGGPDRTSPGGIVNTAGGGRAVSASYRARVLVGAPQPMGTAAAGNVRVRLGPLVGP
jgi:hypothetical protein